MSSRLEKGMVRNMRLIRPRTLALALLCVTISGGSQSRSAPNPETTNIGMAVTEGNPSEDKIALTTRGILCKNCEFIVLVNVKTPKAGHKVLLRLPQGMTFAGEEKAMQEVQLVKGESYGQASWRVEARATGTYVLEADLKGRAGIKLATAREKLVIKISGCVY